MELSALTPATTTAEPTAPAVIESSTTQSTTSTPSQSSDGPSGNTKSEPHPLAETVTRAQTNQTNAYRRSNRQVREENQRLKQRLAELEGDESPEGYLARQQLSSQSQVYENIIRSDETDAFQNQAEMIFGAETPAFMEQTYKYARYVNQAEPDLRRYINKPLGLVLLREWYNRMDNPQLARQWQSFTAYEKGKVLADFYSQLEGLAGQTTPGGQQKQSIPAVGGGRETETIATDDFGGHLQKAFQMAGRKF